MLAGAVCAAIAGLHHITALQPCARGSTPTPSLPMLKRHLQYEAAHGLQLPAG